MFHLIHPNIRDHGSCASILADLAELLAIAISAPNFGEGKGERDGGAHLAMTIATGLRDLDELAIREREAAREDGYREGADAAGPGLVRPDLTEPAPQPGKRRRAA